MKICLYHIVVEEKGIFFDVIVLTVILNNVNVTVIIMNCLIKENYDEVPKNIKLLQYNEL